MVDEMDSNEKYSWSYNDEDYTSTCYSIEECIMEAREMAEDDEMEDIDNMTIFICKLEDIKLVPDNIGGDISKYIMRVLDAEFDDPWEAFDPKEKDVELLSKMIENTVNEWYEKTGNRFAMRIVGSVKYSLKNGEPVN